MTLRTRFAFPALAAALAAAAWVLNWGSVSPYPAVRRAQAADDYVELRESMVREQILARGVSDRNVLAALRSVPRVSDARRRLEVIPGGVPNPADFPSGCRFHPRCSTSRERAAGEERDTKIVDGDGESFAALRRCVEGENGGQAAPPTLREAHPGHFVACWEAAGYDRDE